MKPVERSEVLPLGEYEQVRSAFRQRVIEEKKRRRVQLGPHASAVFENRDTVLLQIQEMLRTERITREAAVRHEIETYHQLLPGALEVSASVFVEIDDKEAREAFLVAARGIERAIALVVGGERFAATWDPDRILPDRASAVLYLKFPLSAEGEAALRTAKAAAELVVEHEAYRARAPLGTEALASLAEDFEG
jgi:hypothetical protein